MLLHLLLAIAHGLGVTILLLPLAGLVAAIVTCLVIWWREA